MALSELLCPIIGKGLWEAPEKPKNSFFYPNRIKGKFLQLLLLCITPALFPICVKEANLTCSP